MVIVQDKTQFQKKTRAMSLPELIIGLALFAIAIIPIFGIIPTAYMSIKKAEDYSSASCYAQEVIDIYRADDPSLFDPYRHTSRDVFLNETPYHMDIGVYGMDENIPYKMIDVVVILTWKKIPERLSVFTRISY
jgi:hypothetical protein